MAGISDDKIREICAKNNISDENLMQALTEIIAKNNEDIKDFGIPLFE